MKYTRSQNAWSLLPLLILTLCLSSFGQAKYRVAKSYEDTVRVEIIWNNPTGSCNDTTNPVGEKTKNFVLKALDSLRVKHIKTHINTQSKQVSWADIVNAWGADSLPHVIVHVNAGWSTGWNTTTLQNTFTEAIARKIGIVSVGDDAASLADQTFGFVNVDNVPAPLGDGTSIDSLWIGLIRSNDDKLKVYQSGSTTQLEYPYVNGIISNAVDSIMNKNGILQFFKYGKGRCQADADRYGITNPRWLTMLGYQQGFLGGKVQPDRSNDLNVLVAIQDTLPNLTIRRGVAVSFQPQFLQNTDATQQIVYDAIMFASLAHTLSVPSKLIIKTQDDTIVAGDIDTLQAYVIDQKGDTIKDAETNAHITWHIIQPHAGDAFVGSSQGSKVLFTAIEAYRDVYVYAEYVDDNGRIADTAKITIIHGPADHLVIEDSPNPPLFGDHHIGGGLRGTMTIGASQVSDSGYAVLRDKYTNFVNLSKNTAWDTLPPSGTITVAAGRTNIGEGVATKINLPGSQKFVAKDISTNFKDTVTVSVENISYDSLRIMKYDVATAKLVRISSLTLPLGDTTTLFLQGLRTDRLGPIGSGGWIDVPGNWSITSGLKTTPNPPSGQQAWKFSPTDTGHGTITAKLPSGTPSVSISAVFTTGAASSLAIYSGKGNPSLSIKYADWPTIVDSVRAGKLFSKIHAKVFDIRNNWLSQYENNSTYSSQIKWKITKGEEATITPTSGDSTVISSTRAHQTITVKATLNSLSDSIVILIVPDTAHHLVIEESMQIKDSINDDPLANLIIHSDQTYNYVYAILRDTFGNFVDYSKASKWISLDTLLFTASSGTFTDKGEGKAERVAFTGTSKMIAIDTTHHFSDSVNVILENSWYDSLRIVINDSTRIETLVMRSDQDTILKSQGWADFKKKWETVPANWEYITTTGNRLTLSSSEIWNFAPGDTGTGKIIITYGTAIPDTVLVMVLPGLPAKLALYPKVGSVPSALNPPYPNPTDTLFDTAGVAFPIVAKILDHKNVWLSEYENTDSKSKQIHWTIQELSGKTGTGTLSDTNGFKTYYTATEAYRALYVIGSISINQTVYKDTILLYTVPGKPAHLFLEGSPQWTVSPNDPNPIDTVKITDSSSLASVFAILRDSLGNFCKYAYVRDWLVVNNDTLVSVRNGNISVGEGIIQRNGNTGETKIYAIDTSGLSDTTVVKLLPYHYLQLRILSENVAIDELTMNTNQDTTLVVQGLRSDNQHWEDVVARWENSSNLKIVPIAPSANHSWRFSPSDTGRGYIRVTMDNDLLTKPDTLPVVFTRGAPTRISIEILTPPKDRIAGKPIITDVKLYNNDGLFPGDTCFSQIVKYSDVLGPNGRPLPYIVTGDNEKIYLSDYGSECFRNGTDTLKLTLFYAPFNQDSTHQISVNIGTLTASTEPFILYPDSLDSIGIEVNNIPMDTLRLSYHDDPKLISAVGYDQYGNKRGSETSNWINDGTLHTIDKPSNVSRIVYGADQVKDNENGTIHATSVTVPSVNGKLVVVITGPLNGVASAITRDANGNGYLDGIDLVFNRSVSLPDKYMLPGLVIQYQGISFVADSITKGPNDSTWHIVIQEVDTTGPQTNWTPQISFEADTSLRIDATSNHDCKDGAGPVITKVEKVIKDLEDHTKDEITIQFSEPILNTAGNQLSSADAPSKMFYVWEKLDDGTFKVVDSILIGIDHLKSGSTTSVTFTADNGKDIAAKYYVSFNGNDPKVFDMSNDKNVPVPGNKKVKVIVTGPAPREITSVPNPSTPTVRRVPAGTFSVEHNPNARKWVYEDHSGTVFTFPITLPPSDSIKGGSITVRCRAKIYDLVGNKVIENEQPNILKNVQSVIDQGATSKFDIDIYWNGFNSKGMMVAPGVYKIIVYIKFEGPGELLRKYNLSNTRLIGMVGISR